MNNLNNLTSNGTAKIDLSVFDDFVEQFPEFSNSVKIDENKISASDSNFISYQVKDFYAHQKFYDIKYLSENIVTMMISYMMLCDTKTITTKIKESNQYIIRDMMRFIYKADLPSYNKIKNMNEDEIKNQLKKFEFYYDINQMEQLDAVFLYILLFGSQLHHYDNLKSIMPIDIEHDIHQKLKDTDIFHMQYVLPALIDQEYAQNYIHLIHQIISKLHLV